MSRQEQFVLAVDLGTGGPKVGLVSLTGQVAWHDHIRVETSYLDGGGAEQDPEEWWRIIVDAGRRAASACPAEAGRVSAVSVTGQYASTVPVDEAGDPVAACMMWMDTRGGPHSQQVIGGPVMGLAPRPALRWLRRAGVPPSPAGDDPLGHMLYLDRSRPEVARKARWYLEPVDFLTMRFSGIAAASPCSMATSWLLDTRRAASCEYDRTLLRMAGVDRTKLPPLRPTGSVVGTVQANVAAQLGIPASARVVSGTPDLHSAAVGSGAVGDFEPHMAVSTTAWISCPIPFKKTDVIHGMATVPGLTSDRYLIINNQDTAGRSFEWFRDNVAGRWAPASYADLLDLAASSLPGSGGVVFTPWLTGERSPISDRHARGGFHNVSLSTGLAELTRAVLEGVAYNSRWLYAAVEKLAKRQMNPVRMIGGAAQSDLWCQIFADVLDRQVERVAEPLHANLRGAALYAGVALGEVRWDEVRDLVYVDRTFVPNPANRRVYDTLFDEFPRFYKGQKRSFARLNPPTR